MESKSKGGKKADVALVRSSLSKFESSVKNHSMNDNCEYIGHKRKGKHEEGLPFDLKAVDLSLVSTIMTSDCNTIYKGKRTRVI